MEGEESSVKIESAFMIFFHGCAKAFVSSLDRSCA